MPWGGGRRLRERSAAVALSGDLRLDDLRQRL